MLGLTPRQADLLAFLRAWPNPWAPTFQQMREGLGYASNSQIQEMVDALEERGHIRRLRNRACAIELTPAALEPPPIFIDGERYRFIPKTRAA